MVYFRTDGNESIASGHVMRCLTIAQALRDIGEESTFLLADKRSKDLIEARGFAVLVLDSAWNALEQELDKLAETIRTLKIEKLFIDSYYVTKHYLRTLHEQTRVVYLDDLMAFPYPVSMVINYGIICHKYMYESMYQKAGMNCVKCLVGKEYVPLRREFQNCHYEVKRKVKDILITTGGTDPFHIAYRLLERFFSEAGFQDLNFYVVIGCFHQNRKQLYQMQTEHENVTIYENITNMAQLMQRCDVAVTAGGSTTCELCAVGVPSVCLSIAQNQQEGAKIWEREGLMLYAGDMQQDETGCIQGVFDKLQVYLEDYGLRKSISEKMRKAIDGLGAERIARELFNM